MSIKSKNIILLRNSCESCYLSKVYNIHEGDLILDPQRGQPSKNIFKNSLRIKFTYAY